MRSKPDLWRGADRIQWGCVLMRLLGESSLQALPLVLSGLSSVEQSRQVAPYQAAVRTARVLIGEALTQRAVQSAVFDFLSTNRESRSFDIDGHSLTFQARSMYDPEITKAEKVLLEGLPLRSRPREFADTSRDLVAQLNRDRRIRFRLNGLSFPAPSMHDLDRRPNGPITVYWSDLESLAAELDEMDLKVGRLQQNWQGRLAEIRVHVTTGSGLREADALHLSELKHLIGLPGSGKTTIIVLLCIFLARSGLRVAVFFTAIQLARSYLETLRSYEVTAALLVGRSPDTHLRHANQLAELVATQGDGGFAHTKEGVELLAQSCPLPAFADPWPDNEDWSFGEAPCETIYEAGSKVAKLCPAWSLCGRVKNQRDLVNASVWLGHVLSADTLVPSHTSSQQLRYFELVGRTFDLVIIDESDETQKVLDDYGALTLNLTGNVDSIHVTLQRTTGLLAANRQRVSDALLQHILRANEFERHTLRFVEEIRRLRSGRPDLAHRYEEKLLTASFLLREAIIAANRSTAFSSDARSALLDLWETAMYEAFFERDDEMGSWRKAQRFAPALNMSLEESQDTWRRLNRAFRRYLAQDHAASAERPIAETVDILKDLLDTQNVETITPHVRLLIAVGFTIASYQRLAKGARPLAHRGELPDANDLVFAKSSIEMRETVPRSILGTFSSIRFRSTAESDGLEIDYLVMDSTPRLLLHRLHEIGGANVLLASATSWLEASSQYHIDKAPDILLSSRIPNLGPVRMYFQPKFHPSTKKPLSFSGAGYDRDNNLQNMVAGLAAPGPTGSSDLERTVLAIRTELGKPRKAALVVNSYQQVRLVVEQILKVNRSLGERTRGVLDALPSDHLQKHFILRGQVESLGSDPAVDILVFPLGALGRATNIVFTNDDGDRGKAAIGSVFFLTRPHPAAGDLSLMLSILARETENLNAEDLRMLGLSEVQEVFNRRRYGVFRQISQLLSRPMSVSQLDEDTLRAFAANLLVAVVQMIGRGTRQRMPVEVYFIDAAWAPNSAEGRPETARSSMLVAMQDVLRDCLATRNPDHREVYQELYGPFAEAFKEISGLIPPDMPLVEGKDHFDASPAGLEDAMDGWDPDKVTSLAERDNHPSLDLKQYEVDVPS